MNLRRTFSSDVKRQAHARSQGTCECARIPWLNRPLGCGIKLGLANTYYEHINPSEIRIDNSISNAAVLCRTCWREKTDLYDRKIIAKSNHTQDKARGIREIPRRLLLGTIASGWKQRMSGGWERR